MVVVGGDNETIKHWQFGKQSNVILQNNKKKKKKSLFIIIIFLVNIVKIIKDQFIITY